MPINKVLSTYPFVAPTPRMDEASSTNTFFCPVLGSVMTGTDHELLTKFLKIKLLMFHSTKSDDAFEFILDCYERLHKFGIVHQHGVEFVTFQLKKDVKQWWRTHVECQLSVLSLLTWP